MKFKINKKSLLITGLSIFLILTVSIIVLIKIIGGRSQPAQAKNKFISPLAESKPTDVKTGSLPIYSLEYYLHLSKSFLYKATRLANDNPSQTDADKMKILNNINKSLKAANQAIKYYPNQPSSYLTRAQIYQKVANFFPEGNNKAQQDIKTANRIMNQANSADIPLEKEAQPLNFIPTQKANLDKKITIAEPNQPSVTGHQSSTVDTNASSGTGILEAGQTEAIIKTSQVKSKTQVYVVPQGGADNKVLTVVAKKDNQWFKVGLDSPSDKDIIFDWWTIES